LQPLLRELFLPSGDRLLKLPRERMQPGFGRAVHYTPLPRLAMTFQGGRMIRHGLLLALPSNDER